MLIDSNDLKKAFCDYCNAIDPDMIGCPGHCDTLRIIDEQPKVEAATVRNAHWIERGGIYACSHCDAEDGVMTKFCSSCGYQMDGGEQIGSESNGCWMPCDMCANTDCSKRDRGKQK